MSDTSAGLAGESADGGAIRANIRRIGLDGRTNIELTIFQDRTAYEMWDLGPHGGQVISHCIDGGIQHVPMLIDLTGCSSDLYGT